LIDIKVIDKCKVGNQRAYKKLYEAMVPYVFSIVKRYIYNSNEWKDLVQESFATLFLNIDKFDPSKGIFKFYARKIVVNTCLQYLRKNKRIPILSSLSEIQEPAINDLSLLQVNNLSRTDIETILEGMPDGYKTIFLLHAIDDFTYDEIAKLLEVNSATVRSQMFRAKKWIINKSIIESKTSSYGLF